MEGNYEVYLGSEQVGKVQVIRQGLYYRFLCRCRVAQGRMYRLLISLGDKQENLGILLPLDGGFGLDTRLASKKLGNGKIKFFLLPGKNSASVKFVPICPEEPFSYISRLKEAYLVQKNGQIGIHL